MREAKFVVLVSNTDGGHPAVLVDTLDEAKVWIRNFLTDPRNEPPIDEEERQRMERDLASLTGEYTQGIQGSDAWKEWIYVAPIFGEVE